MNGRTIFEHGGTNIGFIGENAVDSISGISFSVLTNQDSVDNNTILTYVVGTLHKQTLRYQLSGIEDVEYNSPAVSIYPNPANDILHISIKDNFGTAQAKLYDITGREMMNSTINSGMGTMQTSSLSHGLYILRITDATTKAIYSQKVMIEK